MFDSKPLTANIVRLQQEKKVKVSELAGILGIAPSRFSAWKKGRGQCDPKLSQLAAAANILGVSLIELLTPDTAEKKDRPVKAEKPARAGTTAAKAKKATAKAEAPAEKTRKASTESKPAKKSAATKAEKAPKIGRETEKAVTPRRAAKAVSAEKPARVAKRSAKK